MSSANLKISRSELDSAKDRLRIPELWRILGLPAEPPTREGVKFASRRRCILFERLPFFVNARRTGYLGAASGDNSRAKIVTLMQKEDKP